MKPNISLETLNKQSPYKLESSGLYSFCFTTDYGKAYEVGFIQDYMISDDGVYQFFINAKDKSKTFPDRKIEATVKVILKEFFKQEEAVLDYICDTSDNRQAARSRKFESWFRNFADNNMFTMFPMNVEVDGISYYAAVITRKDNPRLEKLTSAIKQFEKDMEDKLQ